MVYLKNKKVQLLVVLIILLAAVFFIVRPNVINKNVNKDLTNIPTYTIEGSYNLDVDDPNAVVGDADYVFAGKVIKQNQTIYKNKVPLETENGDVEYSGEAYTPYDIKVVSNIKNELDTDRNIPIEKLGGIREDGSAYDVFESDCLPNEGKTYIFIAYTQDDGSLLVSGPNSNIEVKQKEKTSNRITSSQVFKEYQNAVKEQIPTDREKQKSKYDVSEK